MPPVGHHRARHLISVLLCFLEKLLIDDEVALFADFCEWCLTTDNAILFLFEVKYKRREVEMNELDHPVTLRFHELVVVRWIFDIILSHQLVLGLV